MRDSSEIWCETSDVSVEEIDRRARLDFERGGYPTLVFISIDLITELTKIMGSQTRFNTGGFYGSTIMSIHTAVGALNFKPVKRLKNFLLVGRQEDFDAIEQMGFPLEFWSDEERARVVKAFEDEVLKDRDET